VPAVVTVAQPAPGDPPRPSRTATERAKRTGAAEHLEPPEAELFRERHSPTTRRLLLAALESFASRGYHGTTTRVIARRANVSAAGLYTHYRSKGELLEQIVAVTHEAMLTEMRAVFAQPGTPIERLGALVHTHARFHATYHIATRVANYELKSLPDEPRERMVRLRQEMQRIVAEALRLGTVAGVFQIPDEQLTTTAILSLGIDVSRWYRPGHRLTPDDVGEEYALLVTRLVTRLPVKPATPRTSWG
jgi:AcrR family transcriptional regulator